MVMIKQVRTFLGDLDHKKWETLTPVLNWRQSKKENKFRDIQNSRLVPRSLHFYDTEHFLQRPVLQPEKIGP